MIDLEAAELNKEFDEFNKIREQIKLKNQEEQLKCTFIPQQECSSEFYLEIEGEDDLAFAEDEESHMQDIED